MSLCLAIVAVPINSNDFPRNNVDVSKLKTMFRLRWHDGITQPRCSMKNNFPWLLPAQMYFYCSAKTHLVFSLTVGYPTHYFYAGQTITSGEKTLIYRQLTFHHFQPHSFSLGSRKLSPGYSFKEEISFSVLVIRNWRRFQWVRVGSLV